MKVKKLQIKNFKSLQDVEIALDPYVSIIIGKNNSGKSNIIDALNFLSELIQKGHISHPIDTRGGYENIVFRKKENDKIEIILEFIINDDEIENLYNVYQIESVSKEDFIEKFDNSIWYEITVGKNINSNSIGILQECIIIKYDDNRKIYSKGETNKGMYSNHIVTEFKEAIESDEWTFKNLGGSTDSRSILNINKNYGLNTIEIYLLIMIITYLSSVKHIAPVRYSPESQQVLGTYLLNSNCTNLPQVLNTLASSRRLIFDNIISDLSKILSEINEIQPYIIRGETSTRLTLSENTDPSLNYLWRNVSSGTKDILFMLTLLHTADRGSIITIEEPELHLHDESVLELRNIILEIANSHNKQIIITTHSSVLIDKFPWDQIRLTFKENGSTMIESLQDGIILDEFLTNAGINRSSILQSNLPSCIVLVEGRDDMKVLNQFFHKQGLDPEKLLIRIVAGRTEGGEDDAIKAAEFLKKIRKPIPFVLVLDSDNKKTDKEAELKTKFEPNEYYVLDKKEIESYLINAKAISIVIGKTVEETQKVIDSTNKSGKQLLNAIFKQLGLTRPREGIKEVIALNLDSVPEDIVGLISLVNAVRRK